LNGLTTIFGDRRALFKVQTDSAAKQPYFLAEGQRAGGIELLSVDIRAGKIKVNNHGTIQTITLCDPPNLSTLSAAENNGAVFFAGQNAMAISAGGKLPGAKNGAVENGKNAAAGFAPTQSGGAAGKNSSSAPSSGVSSAGEPGTSDAGDANTSTMPSAAAANKPEPYSLTAAREFERLRIQTAAAVYDGIDEPIPLTPLTPPGTPMALIGPDRAWFPD
jgi:hypothetical protein